MKISRAELTDTQKKFDFQAKRNPRLKFLNNMEITLKIKQ